MFIFQYLKALVHISLFQGTYSYFNISRNLFIFQYFKAHVHISISKGTYSYFNILRHLFIFQYLKALVHISTSKPCLHWIIIYCSLCNILTDASLNAFENLKFINKCFQIDANISGVNTGVDIQGLPVDISRLTDWAILTNSRNHLGKIFLLEVSI